MFFPMPDNVTSTPCILELGDGSMVPVRRACVDVGRRGGGVEVHCVLVVRNSTCCCCYD